MSNRAIAIFLLTTALAIALVAYLGKTSSEAASHREAPLIALDPTADITDFFMFRSYETGKDNNIILIMNVIPGEEPSSGPNYYNFDPNVLYAFHVDNNADGEADDVEFEFQFTNEFRGVNKDLKLFTSYIGFPPITALDGPGSEGIGLRQKYEVTMVRNNRRTTLGQGLIVVPSNVGPRTMPNYPALAAQGIYDLGNGVRVFAGQRQDPFYIDLGATFDTLNFRRRPPVPTPAEAANDNAKPFGVDMLSGFNVHSIALELPASLLTRDGKGSDVTASPVLGAYASTSRRTIRVLRKNQKEKDDRGRGNRGRDDDQDNQGDWVQVQRLANPLVNEAIIGTIDKDHWNAVEPDEESQFVDYYLNPRLALALQLEFGVPAATSNRTDLRDLLLKYSPTSKPLSELLRLNINVAPTPFAAQRRMTVLATPPDPAGWPNGRRPKDDVTDIAVRVVGGPNYIAARAGDGVNTDDAAPPAAFPFVATPFDGRNRVHQNP